MADLQRLGTALSGFSAGVSGQLPQFQAGLERRAMQERQGEDQRRKDMFLTNRVLLGDIQAGNIDRAITGLNTRLMELPEGTNTDFTMGMKNLLESGPEGVQEAIRIAQAADQEAVTRGFLDPIAKPEPIQLGAQERLIDPVSGEVIVGAAPAAAATDIGKLKQDLNNELDRDWETGKYESILF